MALGDGLYGRNSGKNLMTEDEARSELANTPGHDGMACRAIVEAGDDGQHVLAAWCMSAPGPDWIQVAWCRAVIVLRLPENARAAARMN